MPDRVCPAARLRVGVLAAIFLLTLEGETTDPEILPPRGDSLPFLEREREVVELAVSSLLPCEALSPPGVPGVMGGERSSSSPDMSCQ